MIESFNLTLVLLLAFGFALAAILGYLSYRLKLSPILGYLLAGYLIGPYSPGYVADLEIAEQLAEIGVVLMMFGIGLDFRLKDFVGVKNIAVPGAFGQTLLTTILGAFIFHYFGWSWKMSIVTGLAVGVASTVVLGRMLEDHHLLKTREGKISIGWLIVEDLITVVILVLIPNIATVLNGGFSWINLAGQLGLVFAKLIVLGLILLTLGRKFVAFCLSKIFNTKSHELFTLTVLALIFVIAVGSTYLFGISIALGAFFAGMVIGQTEVREKALSHSLPMKDAFIAIFFLTVGMLFNPFVIMKTFPIFIVILAIILILKPLIAFIITVTLRYQIKTGIIVAAALAQIGEFSFILSEEAMKYDLMTDDGYDLIVACAIISIAINPLIFKMLHRTQEV